MELTPSQVIAPPGTKIEFICKYRSHEPLQIIIVEYGLPRYCHSDIYGRTRFGGQKIFYSRVGYIPSVIQCYLKNIDDFIVGMVTARINPGLK